MACDATTLIAAAVSNGYQKLSDRDLLACILAAACAGGGGGGTAFNNQTGNGTPVGVKTPDYIGQFYTDFNTPGSVWVANGLTNADWREYIGNL